MASNVMGYYYGAKATIIKPAQVQYDPYFITWVIELEETGKLLSLSERHLSKIETR